MYFFNKDRLRGIRKQHNMTQDVLAERLGVKHNTVSGYETGSSVPDAANLLAMANIFGVNIDYFTKLPDTESES